QLEADAEKWKADHTRRAALINQYCWDEETGFFYNVNKSDHSFTSKTPNDLKRMEIIGFLPLWAGIADEKQAAALTAHLTNPEKFWRKYGIPSLAADDPYYNDKGYWNGPVWVQWNYLVMQGLLQYGYQAEARELVDKVSAVMTDRLEKDHNLWEFYSPDTLWGGHHKTYIWAGIVNRMIKEVQQSR
ncbi:MAG TPA: trehalase family glycosidase, partial [Prolixibacteraceae bacterium]|nr:trehalase family glycosidase [Prolixibacteraceae bacterium]